MANEYYELEIFGALCATSTFRINGIDADSRDFGESFDESPDTAEDYGCGNRVFRAHPPNPEIMDKYRISLEQYKAIARDLEDKLSFGRCGWCT